MEAKLQESGGKYQLTAELDEEDLKAMAEAGKADNAGTPAGVQPLGIFGSKHYCVRVLDAQGREVHKETIKTWPPYAPVRALAIMVERGGSSYGLRGGQC